MDAVAACVATALKQHSVGLGAALAYTRKGSAPPLAQSPLYL
jgi:hypothetical protein